MNNSLETVVGFLSFGLAVLAALNTFNSSKLLSESEEELKQKLRAYCATNPTYLEKIDALHRSIISDKDILKLEFLAIRVAESLVIKKKQLLLNGITQSNPKARLLYLKKIYDFEIRNINSPSALFAEA